MLPDKKMQNEFIKCVSAHNKLFGYYWMPNREIIIDSIKFQECIDFLRKSVEENVDYVKKHYHYEPKKTMDLGGWCID